MVRFKTCDHGETTRSDSELPTEEQCNVAGSALSCAGWDDTDATSKVVAAVAAQRVWANEDEYAAFHVLQNEGVTDEIACTVCMVLGIPHPAVYLLPSQQ